MNILNLTEQDITDAYFSQKSKKYTIEDIVTMFTNATVEDIKEVMNRFKNHHTFIELSNILVRNPPKGTSQVFSRVETSLMRGYERVYDWSRFAKDKRSYFVK